MKVIKNWQRYVLEWGILAALKRLRRLRTPWDPLPPYNRKRKPCDFLFCGERGIRTPGTVTRTSV